MAQKNQISPEEAYQVGDAEVFMSVVVPAYNEEERLSGMLEEAVEFLQATYPQPHSASTQEKGKSSKKSNGTTVTPQNPTPHAPRGWEILVVSDGSTDKTVETALSFARSHQLSAHPPTPAGPWTSRAGPRTRSKSGPRSEPVPTHIPHGSIRVVTLEENRGKGGAVTHGMRHARGAYVVFADADGASRFSDLGRLVEGCERVRDGKGRAVGIGSRAHLVGSEAVVKVRKEPCIPPFSPPQFPHSPSRPPHTHALHLPSAVSTVYVKR